MRSILPAVAEQLFTDIKETYDENSQIPDDLLIACNVKPIKPIVSLLHQAVMTLRFVFGSCALQALDLVDQCAVTCVSSPSGRKAFQVVGGSGRLYTCFISCHYCPCPAFTYSVLRRNEGLLCKHILAAYLCQAIGVIQKDTVSDQQMSTLLCGTAALDT